MEGAGICSFKKAIAHEGKQTNFTSICGEHGGSVLRGIEIQGECGHVCPSLAWVGNSLF